VDENLAGLDHAQTHPCDFLDCIGAGLEILDLSKQRRIAQAPLIIQFALLGQLALELPDAQPPTLSVPQRVLDQDEKG